MVRAPCCEKMGLKKGPWTPEEDQVLVAYIQKSGHGNWRALPKLAGLLRCGKSCRLRWTNYLRPDIKRGNFSKEEEESIIELHEMLGNRWSAIASRLPGRTDNEIKNVWHTHLKKKLKNYEPSQDTKRQKKSADDSNKSTTSEDHDDSGAAPAGTNDDSTPVSPQSSSSEVSTLTDSAGSGVTKQEEANSNSNSNSNLDLKSNEFEFECDIPHIDESFWSEELSLENDDQMQLQLPESNLAAAAVQDDFTCTNNKLDDGMDFWYDLFIRAGELPDLPEF